MAYLFPPMDDEPPPDYLAFVAARLAWLHGEALRLCGAHLAAAPAVNRTPVLAVNGTPARSDDAGGRTRYDLAWTGQAWQGQARTDRTWQDQVGNGRAAGDAATALAMEALTDLAAHWRRLAWEGRLRQRDVRADYLARRLAKRTGQWREEQLYPVEVTVRDAPRLFGAPAIRYARPAPATVAQRLAPLLPSTVRDRSGVVAEAEIAWVHAYRRHVWHRYARVCAGIALVIAFLIQFMSQASGT